MFSAPTNAVSHTDINDLEKISSGKVRDVYAVDDERLLIVASDRLSAYDVILPDPIPGKGAILTAVSNFWFEKTAGIIKNHLLHQPFDAVSDDQAARDELASRASVVRRLAPLPIEAVVRGYLIGSGWNDYRKTGSVCGHRLPEKLAQAARLETALFTPATKAAAGDHDENIDFEQTVSLIGTELATRVRDISIALYQFAADFALRRGIIIADTKFEFGLDSNGELYLIDEALTPDSSRFWPVEEYREGTSPPSFDKQYVRDYLETLDWNKTAPGPALPPHIIENTRAKYLTALELLTTDS